MFWRWIRLMRSYKVLRKQFPPMSEKELLECFQVDDDNQLLKGVECSLRGLEEIAKENAAVPNLSDTERTIYCGAMGMAREAQERILFLVEKGQLEVVNERKRQKKKKSGDRSQESE